MAGKCGVLSLIPLYIIDFKFFCKLNIGLQRKIALAKERGHVARGMIVKEDAKRLVVKGIDEAKKAVVSAINALQVKQTAPNGNQNGNADQSGNGAQDSTNQNGNGAQGGAGQQIAGNNAGGSGSQNVSTANTGASKSDSDGVKTSKSAKVKTGDVNHGGMYAALGVLGAAILATVLGMRKKGKFWQK